MTCYCRYRLGNAFHELRLDYHAAACYRRCLALNQNDLRFWNDLGSACGDLIFHFEAISCFILKRVLVIKAKLSPFCSYIALRLWPESVAAFHKVRIHRREPNHP